MVGKAQGDIIKDIYAYNYHPLTTVSHILLHKYEELTKDGKEGHQFYRRNSDIYVVFPLYCMNFYTLGNTIQFF